MQKAFITIVQIIITIKRLFCHRHTLTYLVNIGSVYQSCLLLSKMVTRLAQKLFSIIFLIGVLNFGSGCCRSNYQCFVAGECRNRFNIKINFYNLCMIMSNNFELLAESQTHVLRQELHGKYSSRINIST